MRTAASFQSLAVVLCAVLIGACGSDPAAPEVQEGTGGNEPGIGGSGGGGTGGGGGTAGGGGAVDTYPVGPYGHAEGDVVADMTFAGFQNPKASNYVADAANIVNISFQQFYNPTKDPSKPLALVVTASALWCSACKSQAQTTMSHYNYWHPKGVEFLETIFEDNDYNPAKLEHLVEWVKIYKFEFPSVLDPTLKLGAFFNKSASPFNMIIDTSTMKIMVSMEGVMDTSSANTTLQDLTAQ